MTACRDYDELLTLQAAGALEPQDEARVLAHLETCAACRAELDAQREVLGLAALPPPSVREQAVLATLPRTTMGRWRMLQLQQASRMRTTGALLAAAAVVLLALGPVLMHRTGTPAHTMATPVAQGTRPFEETASPLEQWALSDPLADAFEVADAQPERSSHSADTLDSDLEDFL